MTCFVVVNVVNVVNIGVGERKREKKKLISLKLKFAYIYFYSVIKANYFRCFLNTNTTIIYDDAWKITAVIT